ncbi:MAG TPA: hypothetical protein VGB76_02850 [Pyrinomonadaceae bacterium]
MKQQRKKGREVILLLAPSRVAEPPATIQNQTSNEVDIELRERQFFIEQKLSSLHTAGIVCITWWVTLVVFCGTILAATWLHKEKLVQTTPMKWTLFAVLTIFFLGAVGFGVLVIAYLRKFKGDVARFPENSNEGRLFNTELGFFQGGMWIGTVSFILILMAWVVFWLAL